MIDPCIQVLALHERRLERAERDVTLARICVRECEGALKRRRDELWRFDLQRPERERRLYQPVIGRVVARVELDELVMELSCIGIERSQLLASLMKDEMALNDSQAALAAAMEVWRKQMKRVEKLREWARTRCDARRFEVLRQEEREADDRVHPSSGPRMRKGQAT